MFSPVLLIEQCNWVEFCSNVLFDQLSSSEVNQALSTVVKPTVYWRTVWWHSLKKSKLPSIPFLSRPSERRCWSVRLLSSSCFWSQFSPTATSTRTCSRCCSASPQADCWVTPSSTSYRTLWVGLQSIVVCFFTLSVWLLFLSLLKTDLKCLLTSLSKQVQGSKLFSCTSQILVQYTSG